jgi:hypothetical protein
LPLTGTFRECGNVATAVRWSIWLHGARQRLVAGSDLFRLS